MYKLRVSCEMQVVLYFMAMVCNPIFINTFVVFVRLYWFERRFQNVVREARNFRRTKSRTRTEPKDDLNSNNAERGIRGRSIVVLHNGDAHTRNDTNGTPMANPDAENETSDESRTESSTSHGDVNEATDQVASLSPQQPTPLRREITFADEIEGPNGDDPKSARLPQRLSPEEHIKFLENQRNPKDKEALRIPGPRDFDRGSVPEPPAEDDEEGDKLSNQVTSPIERRDMLPGEPVKRNVTIDEPDHPRTRAHTGTFPKLSNLNNGTSENIKTAPTDDNVPPSNRLRARTGTFSSLRGWGTKENEPSLTPYLSWQPTVGRNSAFVDLTEEQREELGGIEYRSLKTLAVILVCECSIRPYPSHTGC